jgi:RHS repeat-associated protein
MGKGERRGTPHVAREAREAAVARLQALRESEEFRSHHVRLVAESLGVLARATFTYNPYGTVTASTGYSTTAFLFSGQYRDAATGFYYLRSRYYDPTVGQFLTVDPDVAATLSPYGYVAGDPLNDTDPSGRYGQPCPGYGAPLILLGADTTTVPGGSLSGEEGNEAGGELLIGASTAVVGTGAVFTAVGVAGWLTADTAADYAFAGLALVSGGWIVALGVVGVAAAYIYFMS